MIEIKSAYVELHDEGTRVYRPSRVALLGEALGVLLVDGYDPNVEEWSVVPGEIVTLSEVSTSSGKKIDVCRKANL